MGRQRRLFRLRTGRRSDAEDEFDEELRAHVEMRVEDLVRQGMDEAAARDLAISRFGGADSWRKLRKSVRSRERRIRLGSVMDTIRRDLTLVGRRARRAPGYTALALLTLTLGIGLTTTLFTVMYHVLLRPLPYAEPDRLFGLWSVAEQGNAFANVSSDNWIDWKESSRTLAATAIHTARTMSVGSTDGATRVSVEEVSGEFFDVMKSRLVLGRTFTDESVQRGERDVVVSERFWRSRLGGVPQLPAEILLDGTQRQVIGVVAAGQEYPAGTDLWYPWTYRRYGAGARNSINWYAVARLAPGVTQAQAKTDLDGIAATIREIAPEALYSWGVGVIPLRDVVVGDAGDRMAPLLGAVLFVLLISCANVAGMSLARTLARRLEFAVHVALGARRGRLVRQIVTEHVVLGLAGGLGGIAVALATTRLIATRAAAIVPRAAEITVDSGVLLFALVASVLAGVLAGAIPAWKASGASIRSVLAGSRGAVGTGGNRAGGVLVVAEIAVALLLLTGTGLFVRSFRTLVSRDLGFDAASVVAAEAVLSSPNYSGSDAGPRIRYWTDFMGAVRQVPGVTDVAVANRYPGGAGGSGFIDVPGWAEPNAGAGYRTVSEDYFDVLRIPLVAGRRFDDRDDLGTLRVTIINQAMADLYWPGQNPIGATVTAVSMESYGAGPAQPLTIIGIVGNVLHYGFEDTHRPEMFTLYRQIPFWTGQMAVLARATESRTDELQAGMQRIANDIDPGLAVDVFALEERVDAWVFERRIATNALIAFGTLALALAAIGIYGLLSFVVAQRTREMGIRVVLGARSEGIAGLMLGRAARLFAIGAVLGLLAAFWLTRLLVSLLVDVAPTDPLTYGVSTAVLAVVCALAAFVPAWRATRVDPLVTLRGQ